VLAVLLAMAFRANNDDDSVVASDSDLRLEGTVV
jgi:hypothetical protein